LVREASPAVLVTVRFDPPAAGAPFSQRKIFGCWQPDRLIFNHRAIIDCSLTVTILIGASYLPKHSAGHLANSRPRSGRRWVVVTDCTGWHFCWVITLPAAGWLLRPITPADYSGRLLRPITPADYSGRLLRPITPD